MKAVLPWLVRWTSHAGARDLCSALAALVGPVQNIFSSPYTFSIPLQAGQSAVLGRLSLSMCLWCSLLKVSDSLIKNNYCISILSSYSAAAFALHAVVYMVPNSKPLHMTHSIIEKL
jgi:hypothetical protein